MNKSLRKLFLCLSFGFLLSTVVCPQKNFESIELSLKDGPDTGKISTKNQWPGLIKQDDVSKQIFTKKKERSRQAIPHYGPVLTLSSGQIKEVNKLSYILELVVSEETRQFRVDFYFKGNESGVSQLKLPREWDGQERLFNQIKNLRAVSAETRIKDELEPHLKSIAYPPNATVHLQYEVVQDWTGNQVKNGLFNRAILQKDYFYFIGNAFWIYPDDWKPTKQVSVHLRWKNVPQGWTLANSFGAGRPQQKIGTSLEDFVQGVYLGGNFRLTAIPIKGTTIYAATRGTWKFPDEEFNSLLKRIMEQQINFWRDHKFPYFLVVLFPLDNEDGNLAGEARTNAFVIYVSKETQIISRLKHTLSHELFHTWNPGRLGEVEGERLRWFYEGFTDYYAYLLLLWGGLIRLDEYLAETNQRLRLYYSSPKRNLGMEQILIDLRSDRDAERQPYLRGYLLAHNWNALIKTATSGKNSLDDVMRDLLKAGQKKNSVLSHKTINDAVLRYLKEGVQNEIERYLEKGETIEPRYDVFGSCVEIFKIEIAPFDAGFDVDTSYATKIITGVRENENAYHAGLRNGQKLVGIDLVRDPTVMASFTVEENGVRKTIKYYPAGTNKTVVPQFRIKESSIQDPGCQHGLSSLHKISR